MEMKKLIDGSEVPFETRTRNTNKGYVLLTDVEILEEDVRIAQGVKNELAHNNRWDIKRRRAYEAKELAGTLPATLQENIDELWKALEVLETNGTELPAKVTSIITQRRAIKVKYKKPE